MTGAELKTLRESLGLSIDWMSKIFKVRRRTIYYWESGHSPIPSDVSRTMLDLDHLLDALAGKHEEEVAKILQEQPAQPKEIVLIRYRTDEDLHRFQPDFAEAMLPATYHAALLARLYRRLAQKGMNVQIVYMEPEVYEAWLDGRADSTALRAEWGARQINVYR